MDVSKISAFKLSEDSRKLQHSSYSRKTISLVKSRHFASPKAGLVVHAHLIAGSEQIPGAPSMGQKSRSMKTEVSFYGT